MHAIGKATLFQIILRIVILLFLHRGSDPREKGGAQLSINYGKLFDADFIAADYSLGSQELRKFEVVCHTRNNSFVFKLFYR